MIANLPEKLNPKQNKAVNIENGPVLVTAGAGSGKTKTLLCRLIKLLNDGVAPHYIVAITFTNKAADEIKNRLIAMRDKENDFKKDLSGMFVGTFHSFGTKMLHDFASLLKRDNNFLIFDNNDSDRLLKKVLINLEIEQDIYSFSKVSLKINQVKNDMAQISEIGDETEEKIFKAYESALTKNNAFDFDDLIQKVVYAFDKHPNILKKYREKYKYFLIDEYQDINQAQYRLVKALVEDPQKLWVVGDDQQAIYGFRFANFRNFLNFENDWPETKTIILDQNYRSTKNIINAASALIRHNKLQKHKNLWTENENGDQIKIVEVNDGEEEADWITTQINQTWDKNRTTAIFYRTNAQSRALEEAMLSRNIPYKIFGGWQFYERQEIKDFLALFRYAFNPQDEVSKERILKSLPKKIALDILETIPGAAKKLNFFKFVDYLLEATNYLALIEKKFKNAAERRENIEELIKITANYDSLGAFLERTALVQSLDLSRTRLATPKGKFIHLMTIHLSKGLEFDQVFISGCNEGILPHQMCYHQFEGLEEERRLMYVAMTRAKKDLSISFYNRPSRFLYEIPAEYVEFYSMKNANQLPDEEEAWIE